MKKLTLLAVLFSLGMASDAFALGNCPTVVNNTTRMTCVTSVFNDSGSTLASGAVVLWDDDDTEFRDNGQPYVTIAASADDPYTAGVMLTGSCLDQSICDIVTHGWADFVLLDDSSDAAPVDTHIGSSGTTAGNAGGYAAGADTCVLGTNLIHNDNDGVDGTSIKVWVDISCE